jgi:hypothetical protein
MKKVYSFLNDEFLFVVILLIVQILFNEVFVFIYRIFRSSISHPKSLISFFYIFLFWCIFCLYI